MAAKKLKAEYSDYEVYALSLITNFSSWISDINFVIVALLHKGI